uniref:Uncharacterized protein n=1 Tax=Oryza brachyantha TaxID=4533 RepID=J3N1I2_ORYBR
MASRVNFAQRTRTQFVPSSGVKRRMPSPPHVSVSSESSDGFPPEPPLAAANGKRQCVEEEMNGADSSNHTQALRELAEAIRRFGEVYERVESAKQEQELRMERDRLEAAHELEDQRVQFFLNMQMELSKANSATAATAVAADVNGTRRTAVATDVGTSSNHHVRYRFQLSRIAVCTATPQQPQYSENNVVDADRGTGNGSDTDNKEDEDES